MRDLMTSYRALVFSVARAYTRNAGDIEDACQEVLLAVWRNAEKFDGARAAEPVFVTMIARRRLIDLLRTTRPPNVHDDAALESAIPASVLEIQVDARAAAEAMATTCTARQCEVIALATLQGLSQSEIANELRLPIGTVKSHYLRGIDRLRRLLENR